MLGIRHNSPTRAEQISSELMESRDHLREAAALIAGSAAERLAPRVEQAKGIVSPKMQKARGAALHGLENMTLALGGEHKRRSRWPMLVGALGVGLVAGTIGALFMTRRSARWDEYEPVTILGDDGVERSERTIHPIKDRMHDLGDTVREAADNVKDGVKNAAGNVAAGSKKPKS